MRSQLFLSQKVLPFETRLYKGSLVFKSKFTLDLDININTVYSGLCK